MLKKKKGYQKIYFAAVVIKLYDFFLRSMNKIHRYYFRRGNETIKAPFPKARLNFIAAASEPFLDGRPCLRVTDLRQRYAVTSSPGTFRPMAGLCCKVESISSRH